MQKLVNGNFFMKSSPKPARTRVVTKYHYTMLEHARARATTIREKNTSKTNNTRGTKTSNEYKQQQHNI